MSGTASSPINVRDAGTAAPPDHVWNHVVETLSADGTLVKRERQCCRCGLVHAVFRGRDNVWTEFWKARGAEGGTPDREPEYAQISEPGGGRVPVPECVAIVIKARAA